MRVEIYTGFGSIKVLCWMGEMTMLPAKGEAIALPVQDDGLQLRVSTRTWRLDLVPQVVEIFVA